MAMETAIERLSGGESEGALISVIVPVFNEESGIEACLAELHKIIKKTKQHSFEVIVVDDGSTDGSAQILKGISKKRKYVQIVELSRNFGKEIALSAGLEHSNGAAAIMIDADLQHPPRLIPQFIKAWDKGADVVVGVRDSKKDEPFYKRVASPIYYKLINAVSDTVITPSATDYRMIDRHVINEFNQFTERNRIVRGLIDWLGYRRAYIHFTPDERYAGKPSYSIVMLLRLAFNSILSMSVIPLRISMYLGIIIMLITAPLGVLVIAERWLFNDGFGLHFSGSAIIGLVVIFMSGLILFNIGLVASYIANIHSEVINRPLYVKKRKRKE